MQDFAQPGEVVRTAQALAGRRFTIGALEVYVSAERQDLMTGRYSFHKFIRRGRDAAVCALLLWVCVAATQAQTDCADAGAPLDTSPPRNMSSQELIQKLVANEDKVQAARARYTFTQDLLVQTLDGNAVDGQFHEITRVSYDEKGRRVDNVSFAEVSTLRGVQLSDTDKEDIRTFMPWLLTSEQAPQYNLTYAGRQHVDDLDTYVFQVEPKSLEKNKRYFQGRIWVDDRDLQMVKLCGKSVPEMIAKKKKKQPIEVRPTFVGYRQIVDGNWFPAYARVDDTLHFGVESIHIREIVKFTGYQRSGTSNAASKP